MKFSIITIPLYFINQYKEGFLPSSLLESYDFFFLHPQSFGKNEIIKKNTAFL